MRSEGRPGRNDAIRRPSPVGRAGAKEAAIVGNDGGGTNSSRAAGIKDARYPRGLGAGPVGQPRKPPGGGKHSVRCRLAAGEEGAETGGGRRGGIRDGAVRGPPPSPGPVPPPRPPA